MGTALRSDFSAALQLLADVSRAMTERGLSAPVLVGGAAVELYTLGAMMTGDFDVVTPSQDAFEEILRSLGFSKPGGLGHTPLGWIHPGTSLGMEVVSATLLDGAAERERLLYMDTGQGVVAIMSIEDMIADRMGQYASGTAPEMLAQARAMFALHQNVDLAYLDRRIRHETGGDLGTVDLEP